jgi:hypothetical protein
VFAERYDETPTLQERANDMRSIRRPFLICAPVAFGALIAGSLLAQQLGYKDTPMLPGGKWHVHDGDRPQPKVIDPGLPSTQDFAGKAPSDAVVLFDGKDLSQWRDGKGNPTKWRVNDGAMECVPGSGYVYSKAEFGDCQLHVEFATPKDVKGSSQGRGNSGVFFFGTVFEIQVLDSYDNKTYPDGQAAALYGQYPPLVNASRKPGEWQTYDILWTAPKYKDGKVAAPAYATVLHNGVVVHNHTALLGPNVHRAVPPYPDNLPQKGPIAFQDHGNPVRFRNVWVRDIKDYDQP